MIISTGGSSRTVTERDRLQREIIDMKTAGSKESRR
jgi:hypothetical protein